MNAIKYIEQDTGGSSRDDSNFNYIGPCKDHTYTIYTDKNLLDINNGSDVVIVR